MTIVFVVLSIYVIGQFLVLIYCVKVKWKDYRLSNLKTCSVSVLIPCRNESRDLPNLLASLDELDYPAEHIEFWLADDRSTDTTGNILSSWCSKGKNRHFLTLKEVDEGRYHPNGKANALAMLSKKSKGEILFFTDADCIVPSTWIIEGVRSFPEDSAILLGVTQVRGTSLFAKMQSVDWWHTLGIVKVMNDLDLGLTGLGNNMMVKHEALIKSGGFENLPDLLTEDLALCRQLLASGYNVSQQISLDILAGTKAEVGLQNFLNQRKRWISGVVSLPWFWQLVLALELLFYPSILGLLILEPINASFFWIMKILVQSVFIRFFASRAGQKVEWIHLLLFDFYQFSTATISILYYFWPTKIIWKSRSYE